ncbi:hypothetical protein HRG_012240 [Hirsutella rhossiliensis]
MPLCPALYARAVELLWIDVLTFTPQIDHLTLRQPYHCQFLQVFSILFPATEARCVESLMVVGTPIVFLMTLFPVDGREPGCTLRLRTDPSATQRLQTCHHYAMEAFQSRIIGKSLTSALTNHNVVTGDSRLNLTNDEEGSPAAARAKKPFGTKFGDKRTGEELATEERERVGDSR